jgi:rRNA biogenesis protein RRP5
LVPFFIFSEQFFLSLLRVADVEVISKFAHLENRLGEPERAQTLMEHILTSYPKRVDVWSSYVDMLVKKGQLESAR